MLRRLAFLAPALGLAACTANNSGDSPMIVLGNTGVAAGTTTCMFTGDPSQPMISHGIINTQSTEPYLLEPLIESRLTALMGQEPTKTIEIQGADITLAAASTGAPSIPDTKFQVLASGFVAPNGGTSNISLSLIPLSDLTAIGSAFGSTPGTVEIQATVTVHGLEGGDRVDSEPFVYGVTVCNDCVIVDAGACPLTQGSLGDPCNVFQDGLVDCCESQRQPGTLICPGVNAM